jgi:hypothetical protein
MNHSKFIIVAMFLILTLSFVSSFAYPSDKEIDFKIPTNESDCNLTISNSTTNIILNQSMGINTLSEYANYTITSLSPGDYLYFSNCGTGEFQVTPNGSEKNNTQLYSRIFLLLFFMFAIFLIQWNQRSINYDKWYNKIAEKYKTKNTFRWVLSAVGYNLFKNSYIFSYLIGLLGMLVLTELTVFFNITSVILIMKIILALYTWGALAVVMVFFSQVQEWIFEWKEDLEKINWGELTSPK